MQDRFKFRVWLKDKNEMRTVHSLHIGTNKVIISSICGNVSVHLDSNKLLMQSTGLKDKNGKLIYEGDIVKLFNDDFCNIHTVKFGDFAMYSLDFQTEYEKGSTAVYGWYLGGLTYPIPLSISLDTSGLELEIIGNIYENPELIGGAEC